MDWSKLFVGSGTIEECEYFRKCCVKTIKRLEKEISYEQFLLEYVVPNVPCILGSWATKTWESVKKWSKDGKTVNWDFLNARFGQLEVPVVDCHESSKYNTTKYSSMPFSEFVKYVLSSETSNQPCLYLKDWHCYRQCPNYKFYENPIYFKSDWLNEFWDNKDDDYRFVYIGPKNSWTPIHADVIRSYSWSANVCGRKRWIIHPPCSRSENRRCVNPDKYEIFQESREVIFIPSGWFHAVYNEECTVSINHNWINAFNVDLCWKFLKERLTQVENEITEFRSMEEFGDQCQKILRADSGMDFSDFYNFIHFIAIRRMQLLTASIIKPGPLNCVSEVSVDETMNDKFPNQMLQEHQASCKSNNASKEIPKASTECVWQWMVDLNRIHLVIKDIAKYYETLLPNKRQTFIEKCNCNPEVFVTSLQEFQLHTCEVVKSKLGE